MEYNPLTPQVHAHREDLHKLRKTVGECRQKLAWYDTFAPAAAASLAAVEEATVTDLTIQLAELNHALANAKRCVGSISPATRRGWNPQYWFSDARSAAKSELVRYLALTEEIEADKLRYGGERSRSMASLTVARESLERYSKFDRDAVDGILSGLEAEIGRSEAELNKREALEKAIDKELEVPMRKLLDLRSRLEHLKGDLQKAHRFERELGETNNGYEKSQIHRQCETNFGAGSPGRVIGKIQREIASTARNMEKLERRLQQIGRRGALDVQKLVIDGSNLCYEAGKPIGLLALRPLCARLAKKFEVTVVFDASIRAMAGVPRNNTLQSQLPGVKIHVVASHTGADETILDAAQDPTTYVVSNDRFSDFPEKPAVCDARIIRHEIINGHILVHDLSIDEEFSNRR